MKNPFYISMRYPRTTLVLLLLITIVLGSGIRLLEQRNSFAGELPDDDPINLEIERVKDDFGERSVLLIGLEAENIYKPETAQKIKALSEALADVPHVLADEILSLSTLRNVNNRKWGLETDNFLEEVPQTAADWQQLREDIHGNATILNRLVSEDGTLVVLAAALEDGFDGGLVYDAINELAAAYAGPEKIHLTGAPILVEDVQRGISGDSRRFIPIAILLIFVGFYICFGRLTGVLLPVSMVIMSIIWTMGSMGYLGLPVTVVSNALPVIMVAVASSYGIHFMNAYYSMAQNIQERQALVEATIKKISMPILITGVTSALGSASLLIFKITSLQEFGIIGAIGFLLATLICLTMLPAVCVLLKPPANVSPRSLELRQLLLLLTDKVQSHRQWVAAAYAVLLALCLYQIGHIKIGDDYIRFFPQSHQGRMAAETFNEKLSGVRVMDLVVDASAYGNIKDEQFFAELEGFQAYLSDMGRVGSVFSYLDVVQHLRENLSPETTAAPSSSEIAQYLMMHEMSATPGEVFALRSEDDLLAKIQVFLKSSDPEEHQALYEEVKRSGSVFFSKGSELTFGGDVMHRIALGTYIVKGKVQNIILALLIVFLCCLAIFRSLRKGLLTLLPIVASLIMVFGCMGLIGIRLGISTSLLTAMIVGIGIDFAVHYLVAFYEARKARSTQDALLLTSSDTGQAIAYDAVSNIAGFSVLSLSGFLPVQHFGWLLAFSMLLIFVNTVVLYPAFFSTAQARRPALAH